MIRVLLLASALVMAGPLYAQTETEHEITARERAFYASFLAADTVAMADIFADAFLYQHGSGQDFTEAQFLALIASKTAVVTRAAPPELLIRDFGDTAVTTGASHVEGVIGENPFGGTLRFVNVWRRDDGVWRLHLRNSQFVGQR